MRCPEVKAFLHPFLDGELQVEQSTLVVQHLELCQPCRDRFEDERRLLERVRVALAERCPDALRAKLRAACGAAAPAMPLAPRRSAIFSLRAAASVAVIAILFVGVDPFCFFGCPTVRALVAESRDRVAQMPLPVAGTDANHRHDVDVARDLARITSMVEVPCLCARNIHCKGAAKIGCCKEGCLVIFADGQERWISFVKARATVHPWLVARAGESGFYICTQDGCRFVGWKDQDGSLCGFIGDERVNGDELLALAADVRRGDRR
ncbi:zf-HC2 domain-containing protein [bacterium]|nr:zf-HC2 domain-containing protein [bacterium]